jgi:glutathione S-transferase
MVAVSHPMRHRRFPGMRLYDYAASANCFKVRLLLAQLGTDYERVPVDIFAGETLTNEFAAINPARTTPVLEPVPGRYLPESAAILAYLAEGTPFLPDDRFERRRSCAGSRTSRPRSCPRPAGCASDS